MRLNNKKIRGLSIASAITLMASNVLPLFNLFTYAESTTKDSIGSINMEDDGVTIGVDETQQEKTKYSEEIEQEGTQDAKVYVSQASTFGVFIPKVLTLDGKKNDENVNKANYVVTISSESNFSGSEKILVVPDASFKMSQLGKDDIDVTITQDKQEWLHNEIDTKGNGEVSATGMSAGSWKGSFNFNIKLESSSTSNSQELRLSTNDVKLGLNSSHQVNAFIQDENVNDIVDWLSDNENITVTNGLVETKAAAQVGDSANITVTATLPQGVSLFTGEENSNEETTLSAQLKVTIIDLTFKNGEETITSLDLKPSDSIEIEALLAPNTVNGTVSWSTTAISGLNLIPNGNKITINVAEDMPIGETYNVIATLGTYSKILEINIVSDEIALEPGLYDENDVMLCSWEDSGIDVEKDYIVNDSSAENFYYSCKTSGTYILTNNYPKATKIVVPEEIIKIGNNAFNSCTNLKIVKMPKNVTNIGQQAFDGCTKLIEINIPQNITSIENRTFCSCNNLTNIKLPTGITNIGNYAFADTNLISIELPTTITNIGEQAFYNCTNLTSINIPANITSIESGTFTNCSSLENIEFSEGLTTINNGAFMNCTSLKNIKLPSSVSIINKQAFARCSGLLNLEFSSNLTTIGNQAFSECSSLTNIKLPSNVTNIDDYAFEYCTNVINIELSDNVISMGKSVFMSCPNLTSIKWKGTIYIDKTIFNNALKNAGIATANLWI